MAVKGHWLVLSVEASFDEAGFRSDGLHVHNLETGVTTNPKTRCARAPGHLWRLARVYGERTH